MEALVFERDRGFRRNLVRMTKPRPVRKPLVEDISYSRHESIYRSYLEKFLSGLGKGHPIKLLMAEHREIVKVLDHLDRARDKLSAREEWGTVTVEEWKHISDVAENMKMVHLHFHKEENILFPELVERGKYVDVQRILAEHKSVHSLTYRLLQAFDKGITDDYGQRSAEISATAIALSERLRRLMYQEKYFLYPTALRLISEDRTWEYIRAQYKKVGIFRAVAATA